MKTPTVDPLLAKWHEWRDDPANAQIKERCEGLVLGSLGGGPVKLANACGEFVIDKGFNLLSGVLPEGTQQVFDVARMGWQIRTATAPKGTSAPNAPQALFSKSTGKGPHTTPHQTQATSRTSIPQTTLSRTTGGKLDWVSYMLNNTFIKITQKLTFKSKTREVLLVMV